MQTPHRCRTAPVAASPSSPSPPQSNAPLGAAEYLRFFKTIIPRSGPAEPAWARWLRIHDQSPQVVFEIRLDRHMTIETVKDKLRTHTGTGSLFMHLTLLDHNDQVVADMVNDELKLFRVVMAAPSGDAPMAAGEE